MKKYQVIYADPPWRYGFSPSKANSIEAHYPTMSVDEIKNLPVPSADSADLYLWTTAPKLLEGLEVLGAWGFEYKTHGIWDKQRTGIGYWFLGMHELLLVGTKGQFSPPDPSKRIGSIYREDRTKHSRKPPGIRVQINKWFPNTSKLELFARKEDMLFDADGFDGWDVWGNEVKSDINF